MESFGEANGLAREHHVRAGIRAMAQNEWINKAYVWFVYYYLYKVRNYGLICCTFSQMHRLSIDNF